MFSFIPLPYKIIAIILLLAATLVGTLAFGYSKGLEKSKFEIAKFEAKANAKIVQLERKNAEISNKVITKYVEKVRTIREKEYVYRDQASNNVVAKCDLSNGWVYLHDISARALPAVPALSSDATSSGIKDNQALETVVTNYSAFIQNSEQLKALQQWIKDTKASLDNKKYQSKNERDW